MYERSFKYDVSRFKYTGRTKKGAGKFYYTLDSVLNSDYTCFREYTAEEYIESGNFDSAYTPSQQNNLKMKFMADLYVENVAYSTKTYELSVRTVMDFEQCVGGICPSVFNATGFLQVEDVDLEVGPTNVWAQDFDIPLTLKVSLDCELASPGLQTLIPGEPVYMQAYIDEADMTDATCETYPDGVVEEVQDLNTLKGNSQPLCSNNLGCCPDGISSFQNENGFSLTGQGNSEMIMDCASCSPPGSTCISDDDCCLSSTCTRTSTTSNYNIRQLDIETFSQRGYNNQYGASSDSTSEQGDFFFIKNGLHQYGQMFSKYIIQEGNSPCIYFMPMSEIVYLDENNVRKTEFYVSAVMVFGSNESRRRLFLDSNLNTVEGVVNGNKRRELVQKGNQDAIIEVEMLLDVSSVSGINSQSISQSQSQNNKSSYGPGSMFFSVGIGFVVIAVVIVVIMLLMLVTSRGDTNASISSSTTTTKRGKKTHSTKRKIQYETY